MPVRVQFLISGVLLTALLVLLAGGQFAATHWLLFAAYAVAVLLSAGMKVALPGNESTMSVNFPFILLAVLQLSPLQAMVIAAISVFAQCKFRVQKFFSVVQIGFNVANAVNATAVCWLTYALLRKLQVAAAPAITAGAITYFFANTVPVALVVAWSSGKKALILWRNFVWFLPFYLVGAGLAAVAHFLSVHHGPATALLVLPAAYTIYRSYNAQAARIRDREQHIEEMEALHLRTIESLAMAIEAKDQDTHDHLLRVRVYVTELGEALQLTHAELQAVKTAALLHDIGKLAVPERIINKPGKLTQEEFEKMKIHPAVGADILERVRFPYPVVPIVRAHHEWWNGMGYPDGLRGAAIPIGARILTVVDSFDAMASDRPYRRAMPLAEAMDVVKKLSGTQFDPRVVEALEQQFVKLEEQARLESQKLLRLNTNLSVSRGTAPGAGFEQDSGEAEIEGQLHALGGDARPDVKTPHRPPVLESPHLVAAVALQTQSLLQITEGAGYALDLDGTLAVLASRLAPLIPFYCMVLYVRSGDELIPQPLGTHAARFFSPSAIPLGDGISGWTAQHERSIVNGNATVEPNYLHRAEHEQDLRSALAIPLRDLDERVFGVLSFYAERGNAFSREHLRALEAAEISITLALKNSMHEVIRPAPADDPALHPDLGPGPEQILAQASDVLLLIQAAIGECRETGQPLALLICGGAAPTGREVSKGPRPYSYGDKSPGLRLGDKSICVLRGLSAGQATERARSLRERAYDSDASASELASVGVAHFPDDGDTAEALLSRAERLMHQDRLQQRSAPVPAGVV